MNIKNNVIKSVMREKKTNKMSNDRKKSSKTIITNKHE